MVSCCPVFFTNKPVDPLLGITPKQLTMCPEKMIEEACLDYTLKLDMYYGSLGEWDSYWEGGRADEVTALYLGAVVILVSSGCFYLWWTDTPVGVTEVADVAEVSAQVMS